MSSFRCRVLFYYLNFVYIKLNLFINNKKKINLEKKIVIAKIFWRKKRECRHQFNKKIDNTLWNNIEKKN